MNPFRAKYLLIGVLLCSGCCHSRGRAPQAWCSQPPAYVPPRPRPAAVVPAPQQPAPSPELQQLKARLAAADRELLQSQQTTQRLADELRTLAQDARDTTAARDRLNEANATLLNELARQREAYQQLQARQVEEPPAPAAPPAAASRPPLPEFSFDARVAMWLLGAMGVSAPVAFGAVLAAKLARRVLTRKRQTPPPAPTAAPQTKPTPPASEAAPAMGGTFRLDYEEQQPIERDDREGRELLRLHALEGRDPLQDAIAGRLVRSRIDAIAESPSVDPAQAKWAEELRRDIDRAFNEVAPTKFTIQPPKV